MEKFDLLLTFDMSIGNIGEVISIWNNARGTLPYPFSSFDFLVFVVVGAGDPKKCFIVNVYPKCNLVDKRWLKSP